MNKKILIIIISSLVLIISLLGILTRRNILPRPDFLGPDFKRMHQQGTKHMMRGNRIGRNFCTPDFMRHRLNLNENQIREIEKLNEKFNNEYAHYDKQIRPQREELHKLLRQNSPDNFKKIRKLLEDISKINVELRMIRIKQGVEISEILSPHQMKELHEERRRIFKSRGSHFWQE